MLTDMRGQCRRTVSLGGMVPTGKKCDTSFLSQMRGYFAGVGAAHTVGYHQYSTFFLQGKSFVAFKSPFFIRQVFANNKIVFVVVSYLTYVCCSKKFNAFYHGLGFIKVFSFCFFCRHLPYLKE